MKKALLTSKYVRVRIIETNEEQVFDDVIDAVNFCQKVAHILQADISVEIIEVSEFTIKTTFKYPG